MAGIRGGWRLVGWGYFYPHLRWPWSRTCPRYVLAEAPGCLDPIPGLQDSAPPDLAKGQPGQAGSPRLAPPYPPRTNLDSIFKSTDITLPTKVRLVKAMVFPVVIYGCECWTVKKAECRRIDAFELWYWRRLLRVPWGGETWLSA